jgi:hypothetical protein
MVYIEDALSKVRGGSNILDFKDLEDAIAAARGGITNGAYVSQFERDRDTLVLAGQLEELDELNSEQLSVAEMQLKILKDQLAYYEEYLRAAREMVDGVDTLIDKTLSPEQAYEILLRAMQEGKKVTFEGGPLPDKDYVAPGGGGGAVFGPGGGGSSGYSAEGDYNRRASLVLLGDDGAATSQQAIRDAALSYSGTGDLAGLWNAVSSAGGNEYDIRQAYGWDIDDIRTSLSGAGIPGFSQGINVVPHDMFARIHEGEAIIPKKYNPYNPGHTSAFGGSGELVAELRNLHQTIHELKAEVAQLKGAAVRTAKNTEGVPQLVDQFDEVTEGGNVLRTEVV